MGIFRPDRGRRGPDPWLDLKLALFALGAALGLFGMLRGNRTLVVVAMAVLVAGVLVRFLPERGETVSEESDETPRGGEP